VGEGRVDDDTVDVVGVRGGQGNLGEFGVLVLLALVLGGHGGGGDGTLISCAFSWHVSVWFCFKIKLLLLNPNKDP